MPPSDLFESISPVDVSAPFTKQSIEHHKVILEQQSWLLLSENFIIVRSSISSWIDYNTYHYHKQW